MWINYISSLDIKLEYRKGTLHTNADMLSRSKCDSCAQCLMVHENPKEGKLKTRMLNTVDTKVNKDVISIDERKMEIDEDKTKKR